MDNQDGEYLMGRWDCGSCGATGQRGDVYQCTGCGAPRPDDVEFYLPEEDEVIHDADEIGKAEAGPDWQCAFCESWVPATHDSCISCNASLADSKRRQQTGEYVTPDASPEADNESPVGRTYEDLSIQGAKSSGMPTKAILVLVTLCVIGVAGFSVHRSNLRKAFENRVKLQQAVVEDAQLEFSQARQELQVVKSRLTQAQQQLSKGQHELEQATRRVGTLQANLVAFQQAVPVTVASHRWTVKVDLQQCRAKPGEGWTRPADAFDVTSEQRVHHHEKVLDRVDTLFRTETYREQDGFTTERYTERVKTGTRRVQSGTTRKSLGNGRFKSEPKYRNEPVYKTVTKTRQKPRMVTRTRQVPYKKEVYRDEPVLKPWYKYKTRVWGQAPSLTRSEEGMAPMDPSGTPAANTNEEVGAMRVSNRTVSYHLVVRNTQQPDKNDQVTLSQAKWKEFGNGAALLKAGNGLITPDEQSTRVSGVQSNLKAAQQAADDLNDEVSGTQEHVRTLNTKLQPLQSLMTTTQSKLETAQTKLHAIQTQGY